MWFIGRLFVITVILDSCITSCVADFNDSQIILMFPVIISIRWHYVILHEGQIPKLCRCVIKSMKLALNIKIIVTRTTWTSHLLCHIKLKFKKWYWNLYYVFKNLVIYLVGYSPAHVRYLYVREFCVCLHSTSSCIPHGRETGKTCPGKSEKTSSSSSQSHGEIGEFLGNLFSGDFLGIFCFQFSDVFPIQ